MEFKLKANVLQIIPYYVKDSAGKATKEVRGHILEIVEVEKKENNLVGKTSKFFPNLDVLPLEVAKDLQLFDLIECIVDIVSLGEAPKLLSVQKCVEVDSANNYVINFGKKLN